MLDIQPTSQTPKYAFGMHDEILVQGISYRPQARRDWVYILARTGAAESFDAGKLAHLVQKGLLRHNKGAFLPADGNKDGAHERIEPGVLVRRRFV